MSPSTTTKVTTDHDEIRRWAEERGAKPAAVARTESDDDPGIVRLGFPGAANAEDNALEEISWDEWSEKFDEHNLAFLYQEETAGGERSNFNKIISRETAEEVNHAVGGKGRSASPQRPSGSEGTSGARAGASRTPTGLSQGRAAKTKRSLSARGKPSSSGRANTRSGSGEKRSTTAKPGGATPGSAARSLQTTNRAEGHHGSSRSSAAKRSSRGSSPGRSK